MRVQRSSRNGRVTRSSQRGGGGSVARLTPTFRSVSVTGRNNQNSAVMTRPTGSVAGDLLLLVVASNLGSYATPSGWTLLSAGTTGIVTDTRSVYQRIADGTATDLPTVTFSGNYYGGGALFAIQNVDTATPFPDAVPTINVRTPADALAVTAPTVVAPSDNTRVFSVNIRRSGTPASGMSSGALDGSTNVSFIRAALGSGANPNVFTFGDSADSMTHSFAVLGAVA